MFCKNCGNEIAEDTKFCPNCGAKNEIAEPETNTYENDSQNTVNEVITEEVPEAEIKEPSKFEKASGKLFLSAFISAAFGALSFLALMLIGLIDEGDVVLFGGSELTAALATVSLTFTLIGFLGLTALYIANRKLNVIKKLGQKTFATLSIILIILCFAFSTWGIVDLATADDGGSSSGGSSSGGSSSGGSYNNNYASGVSKTLGLSLKVDSIKTSGNYTYVYCSVTNVSSRYVATKYRYVKVKAQFKNYSGTIVDTDSTYAVDSTWLEPGETKTFYYMVKNTSIKSATLSFVD